MYTFQKQKQKQNTQQHETRTYCQDTFYTVYRRNVIRDIRALSQFRKRQVCTVFAHAFYLTVTSNVC